MAGRGRPPSGLGGRPWTGGTRWDLLVQPASVGSRVMSSKRRDPPRCDDRLQSEHESEPLVSGRWRGSQIRSSVLHMTTLRASGRCGRSS